MTQRAKSTTIKNAKRKTPDDFESVARRLQCDMDDKQFREKLGKIARASPKVGRKP